MNTLNFAEQFPNETACKQHFWALRMNQGVICKKCGNKEHYWLRNKWQFQCKSCGFRTTLRSGTMMENSNLPFRVWYMTILFMTQTKKGISACEMQRQLNYRRYDTVWFLMHRIRSLMGRRENQYALADMVEFDEGFFEVVCSKTQRGCLKRGKGSQRQENVAVLAESTPLENVADGTISNHCRYFKMKSLENQKAEAVNEYIQGNVASGSIIFSDMAKNYTDIHKYVEGHVTKKSSKETTINNLKWVHIAISNAKRTFLGIYHRVDSKYLQNYLYEFTYKLNRRYGRDLFERVFIAGVFPYWHKSG